MNDRLKHIYEVALVALSQNGYHATSMRDIATAVGIQTPSLYNYFSGKQDLLFRLMRSVMEDLTEQTRSAVAQHEGDPLAGLRAAIETFVLFNTTHPNEAAVSDAGLSTLNAGQRQAIVDFRDEFDAIYTGLIRTGMDREVFSQGDPVIAKNAITSACARIYLWYRPGGRCTPDELAHTLSNYLTAGLLRDGTTKEVL
jgi:AcrR family transcriptional regulator